MRASRMLAAVTVFAASSCPGVAFAAGSATTSKPVTGVWWQPEPSDGAVPPPRSVPPGGLWFQSGAYGDSAVSAVRFVVPTGQRAQTVLLHVDSDQSAPAAVAVDACSPTAAWRPPSATPGAYASRPATDCTKHRFPGNPNADGKTLMLDVGSLVDAQVVDLVLVRPDGDTTSVIDTTFSAPVAGDLLTVPSAASDSGVTVAPPFVPAQPNAGAAPAGSGPALDAGTAPLQPAGPTLPVPATAPLTGAPPQVAGAPPAVAPTVAAPRAAEGRDAVWWFTAASLFVLLMWIAAIISRALGTGSWGAQRYTIYKGARPAPPATEVTA